MKIAYVGNFDPLSVGEPEIAKSFEELGHKVVRIPERISCDEIKERLEGCDLLLFAKFRTSDTEGVREKFLKSLEIPTVCWVFDLYFTL